MGEREAHALETYLTQPTRRVGRDEDFFAFFGHNALKKLNPKKKVKTNERSFASFYFHFLARNSRVGCRRPVLDRTEASNPCRPEAGKQNHTFGGRRRSLMKSIVWRRASIRRPASFS
jgi:hypothetical protein